MQIKFSDLSIGLKIFVILGWGLIGAFALSFLIGFIVGVLSYGSY
jgi:hypothetical protein